MVGARENYRKKIRYGGYMRRNSLFVIVIIMLAFCACNNVGSDVVENVQEQRDKARSTAVMAELKDLNQTVEMFYQEYMKYPANIQEIKEYSPDLDFEASDGGTYEYDADTHQFVHKPKEK